MQSPPTSGSPLIEARGVAIRHDGADRSTPHSLDLSVRPGEVLLVLGPSGSGKSTLALALNGLIPHAVPAELDGDVFVAGRSTADITVAEASRTVGMVFQDPDAQIVTGTLLDEVCFGPENLLVPRDEVLARAEEALRAVGLWERRAENPDRLSGGGRQRLAIACALALGSPVLVLDEPTANLDPTGIDEVYAVLATLVRDSSLSVVLIEHNLDTAVGLVDRVLVLDADGALAMDGPRDIILRDRAVEVRDLGVWLPTVTLAALALRERGIPIDALPLSGRELAAALDALPELPGLDDSSTHQRDSPVTVEVCGLTVARHGRTLLDQVDLTLHAGELTAIIGVNGAGKTTLLQAIAGVVPPPRGTVFLDGLDPARADVRALAARVGFVFQNPEHQFLEPTVADELAHGLRIRGLDAAEIDDRVDVMLRRFGLADLRDRHPFLLSGGQKRRLSVGTALIAGAPILALDEPTFGQDRAHAGELLDILAGLRDDGTTVVIVTHDLQLVADYADRVAVMGGGRLLGEGPASSILGSDLMETAGLLRPPLARAMQRLENHPDWRSVSRLADLPGGRP
ncbi:ABC transporter ATP-binding protein [Herbiconiux sp. L3-i23]|uniref:ABC transporter ATP-binding protein n=1 Tax=Herbiconiux sp. L3-i23 TaxID=2905871 RepID=UPI0020624BC3|nr:ATP-binding cassette domain-containing protein [Herbiconiux sp. L3-i23]BDI24006.1 ABC transporter ATP-binding protein [Herbiconiux sp. L3-i23]